jgi:hypothetical protein
MVTIQLSEEDAKHIESFLQTFMPTHPFQGLNGVLQMKAFNHLYAELRKALDAADSK